MKRNHYLELVISENASLAERFWCCLTLSVPMLLVLSTQSLVHAQPKPILISMPTSTRAIVLDAVEFKPEPFLAATSSPIVSEDKRTRIMLFAMRLSLQDGEDVSAVTADAQDASQNHYNLKVEYVGEIP